nr:unnamed protein product [Digitaria exilis]
MPPLSSLPDEFVEEVLLRLPPDPPASLVRAGLVCKRWCRLVSGAGFRRRFREFHRRSHPILGFLYDQRDVAGGGGHVARFIPMPASFPPHHHAGHRAGVVFLLVKGELFTVDLRSKQITKVYGDLYPCIALVVPYLNFYTPGMIVASAL